MVIYTLAFAPVAAIRRLLQKQPTIRISFHGR
jgi:hypothetical protein